MINDNIFDRISYLVDNHADGRIAKFARMVDSGDQTIRSIVKYRRNYPGYELLSNILHAFEWLNAEWLITGKGEMKKSTEDDPGGNVMDKTKTTATMEDRLLSIIESQQRTIELLSKKGGGFVEGAQTVDAKKTS